MNTGKGIKVVNWDDFSEKLNVVILRIVNSSFVIYNLSKADI